MNLETRGLTWKHAVLTWKQGWQLGNTPEENCQEMQEGLQVHLLICFQVHSPCFQVLFVSKLVFVFPS